MEKNELHRLTATSGHFLVSGTCLLLTALSILQELGRSLPGGRFLFLAWFPLIAVCISTLRTDCTSSDRASTRLKFSALITFFLFPFLSWREGAPFNFYLTICAFSGAAAFVWLLIEMLQDMKKKAGEYKLNRSQQAASKMQVLITYCVVPPLAAVIVTFFLGMLFMERFSTGDLSHILERIPIVLKVIWAGVVILTSCCFLRFSYEITNSFIQKNNNK